MIYHFQGRSYLYNKEFLGSLRYETSKLPSEVTVITCSNNDKIGLLIPQLKRSNISYINVVPQGIEWDNRLKIKYIIDSLEQVTTKYVLILDSIDVLLSKDETDIINKFLEFNKKLIFNASKNNYPKVQVDIIKNRDTLGPFKYLNAGCCIGETSYTKYFYQKCYKFINIDNPCKSEQLIVRHAFNTEQIYTGIDNMCKIFQTIGGCTIEKNADSWIIKA